MNYLAEAGQLVSRVESESWVARGNKRHHKHHKSHEGCTCMPKSAMLMYPSKQAHSRNVVQGTYRTLHANHAGPATICRVDTRRHVGQRTPRGQGAMLMQWTGRIGSAKQLSLDGIIDRRIARVERRNHDLCTFFDVVAPSCSPKRKLLAWGLWLSFRRFHAISHIDASAVWFVAFSNVQ